MYPGSPSPTKDFGDDGSIFMNSSNAYFTGDPDPVGAASVAKWSVYNSRLKPFLQTNNFAASFSDIVRGPSAIFSQNIGAKNINDNQSDYIAIRGFYGQVSIW